ncbi:hypothetical protein [Falsiroseomonas sp. E2-1-a20]
MAHPAYAYSIPTCWLRSIGVVIHVAVALSAALIRRRDNGDAGVRRV